MAPWRLGEPPPDGALAAAGQADEDQVHGLLALGRGGAAAEPGPARRPCRRGPVPRPAPRALAPAPGPGSERRCPAVSASESPPNFSRTKSASVRQTIASATTPAAGTTLMSLRS